MRKLLLTAIFTALTTGCSGAVENFVRNAAPNRDIPLEQVGGAVSSREGLRISNGSTASRGNLLGAEMTIGPSQQAVKGTTLGARIGLSQNSLIR